MHIKNPIEAVTPRVLLVYPQTPSSYWEGRNALSFIGAKAAQPPLSLITVAALLPKDWHCKLIDTNVQKLDRASLRWADVVFISGMIIHKASIMEIINQCRRYGKPTVIGGPFVTSSPDAVELQSATSIFIGECEDSEAFSNLIYDVANNSLKPRYVSAAFAEIVTERTYPKSWRPKDFESNMPRLKTSPTPRFDLLEIKAYASLSMQISRGCPFNCEFCDVIKLFGRKPRYKKTEQTVAELDAIYKTGFRGNVFVVDDNFIGNIKKTREILVAIGRWQRSHNYPFGFYTECDVRLAKHEELVDLMVTAGFFAIFTGFETSSQEALTETRKMENVKAGDMRRAVRRLREKGLMVYGGFIVGFDSDGPDCFEQTFQFIDEMGIDCAMVGTLTAIPATDLETRLISEGRIVSGMSGNQFDPPNFTPKKMTRSELIKGYRKLMEELYRPRNFFKRAYHGLAEWRPGPKRKIVLREWFAIIHSTLRQGVISGYSWHYWRFMISVALWHREKLSRAFAIAIAGHHFCSYTKYELLPRLRDIEEDLRGETF